MHPESPYYFVSHNPRGFAWGIKSKKIKMLSCPGLFKLAGLEVENSSKKVKPHD